MLRLLVAHLQFAQTNRTTQKLQKSHQSNATQSEYTKHNEKKGGRITRVLQKSGLSENFNNCSLYPQKPFLFA